MLRNRICILIENIRHVLVDICYERPHSWPHKLVEHLLYTKLRSDISTDYKESIAKDVL